MNKLVVFLILGFTLSPSVYALENTGIQPEKILDEKTPDSLIRFVESQNEKDVVYAREIYILQREVEVLRESLGYLAGLSGNSETVLSLLKFHNDKHENFVKEMQNMTYDDVYKILKRDES